MKIYHCHPWYLNKNKNLLSCTHLFSVGLKIINQNKHPDNTNKYNQFDITTHDDDNVDDNGYCCGR